MLVAAGRSIEPEMKPLRPAWRGFGASSRPEVGYSDQRLADDVLPVLDSLKIVKTVLVGHSMAGSEMTTLGVQHSDRLSGLVYPDAGDDPGNFAGKNPTYQALFKQLPDGTTANGSGVRCFRLAARFRLRAWGHLPRLDSSMCSPHCPKQRLSQRNNRSAQPKRWNRRTEFPKR